MLSGVRIEAATKANLTARVFDVHGDAEWMASHNDHPKQPFMAYQETVHMKAAWGDKEYVAVPLRGARPSFGSLIKREDLPRAIMEKGGFIHAVGSTLILFKVDWRNKGRVRGHGGFDAIGPRNARRTQVVPMYALVHSWPVQARYGFVVDGKRVILDTYAQEFAKALNQAIRTAR